MVDIISDFSGYLHPNAHRAPVIENSQELQIAKLHSTITGRLAALRKDTMAFTFIGPKGEVKTDGSPALVDLQSKIAAEEARLQRVIEAAGKMNVILSGFQVESVAWLQSKKATLVGIIHDAPFEAWHNLRIARGEGERGEKYRMTWLPSDIIALPEYKAQEDAIRGRLEKAKADLVPVNAALKELEALASAALAA